jgi:hypothetical protein
VFSFARKAAVLAARLQSQTAWFFSAEEDQDQARRREGTQHPAHDGAMFWSTDGKPMSAAQFVERLFGELPQLFKDEDELRRIWSRPDTRKALLQGLAERGFGAGELAAISSMIDAEKSDIFDVLAYIGFALAPVTRARSASSPARAGSSRITIQSCRPSWTSCSLST